jgi:hypothetical protein
MNIFIPFDGKKNFMKKVLNVKLLVLFILAVIAYFTKPSDEQCRTKITQELNKRGYKVAIYFQRDKNNQIKGLVNDISIKDRLIYKDVYYYFEGENKKIGLGAFGKVFLVN